METKYSVGEWVKDIEGNIFEIKNIEIDNKGVRYNRVGMVEGIPEDQIACEVRWIEFMRS